MATSTGKTHCVKCSKEKSTLRCGGCLKEFCFNHLEEHRQELNKQLDEIQVNRDLFRQSLTEQMKEPKSHPLIQQIDKWKHDSIKKIEKTAEEAKQFLVKHITGYFDEIEIKLNKLTNQLREIREENDFNEINLRQFQEELTQLTTELAKPPIISIRQDSSSFINNIYVDVPGSSHLIGIDLDSKWIQNGLTIAGGNAYGNRNDQLYHPCGLYLDDNRTIYIVDQFNHRIVEWKYGAVSGQVVAGGNGQGSRTDQLNIPVDVIIDKMRDSMIISDYNNRRVVRWPRRNGRNGEIIISDITCHGLAIDDEGSLYVTDADKVRRFRIGESQGTVVAGGNGEGNRLDQLNYPAFILIDRDHSVYVSETNNHRVVKWIKGAKEGIVVAGGQGQGNSFSQLSSPSGIIIDKLDTVYVAEAGNNRIMRWSKGATQGNVIVGGNGQGGQLNQLSWPVGLSLDRQGNRYVADFSNHRVQTFIIGRSE